MNRVMVMVGAVLMVIAFLILGVFVIAPAVFSPLDSAPLLKNVLQSVICKQGEALTASYSEYDTPTSTTRSTDLTCVNNEKQGRDVSGAVIGIGLVGYLVPFLGGLFLTMIGANRAKSAAMGQSGWRGTYQQDLAYLASKRGNPAAFSANIAPGGNMTVIGPDGLPHAKGLDASGHQTLAHRLSELKDAFDSGLLTQEEYDGKRKELLKEV
ncbi:MAG TPA: SHOCT domain-containing protein [Aggregatilineales bacterium]|nr:SHOCT domain-containing protein [Aggregatilineales bacterium]